MWLILSMDKFTILLYIIIVLIVVALDFRGEGKSLRFYSYFWEMKMMCI